MHQAKHVLWALGLLASQPACTSDSKTEDPGLTAGDNAGIDEPTAPNAADPTEMMPGASAGGAPGESSTNAEAMGGQLSLTPPGEVVPPGEAVPPAGTPIPQEPPVPGQNPVIWADVPDPAVIRVDDTYYMSSTTMHMSPGLPIMRSKDLLRWDLVGYAYDRLAENDALNLQNGQNAYGQGSWASSLRYNDGTFYVSTFSASTGRTHVFSTQNIETGPWQSVSFAPSLHDNSLFFDDDGRVYMVHGADDIRLTELAADASRILPGGIDQVIVPNASLVAGANVGLGAEGSHLRKIDGTYYLMNITWPSGDMRTAIIHRSQQLTGPYEGRVALRDQGIAQGGLIDTPDGQWHAFLFQDSGSVGRIPHLVPVRWEDGWPVLGVEGRVPAELDILVSGQGTDGIVASDEFERLPGTPALPLAWQWNHNPDNALWSLDASPGALRLTTGRVDAQLVQARNTLTQRTFGPVSAASIAIDVSQMRNGDRAGLTVLQQRYGFVGVTMDGDTKNISMVSAESGAAQTIQAVPLDQARVFLKVECDFRNRTDKAYFFYSLDGNDWIAIGQRLQMSYTLPHFMGYRFGVFNFSTVQAGGSVDVDYFHLSDEITAVP
jgi:beta-xylosidase